MVPNIKTFEPKKLLQFSTLSCTCQLSIGYLECPEPEPDRLVIFGFMSTVRTKYFGVVPSTGVRISTRERETFERLRFNLAWRSTCIS